MLYIERTCSVPYCFDGNYLKLSRDAAGSLKKRELYDPDNTLAAVINFETDPAGREYLSWDGIDGTSDSLPNQQLGYDGAGNLDTRAILKDAVAQTYLTTHYGFDELNRLKEIINPGSTAANTLFEYDSHDNRTRVTDDNSLETTFKYDDFGCRTERNSPDTGVTEYTCKANGLVDTVSNGNNITLTYQYDELNRLTQIQKNDTTPLITLTYDEPVEGQLQKGYLTSMEDKATSFL